MKACTPCAKLKIKCELRRTDDKCKRCIRLGKQCERQAPGAHSSKGTPVHESATADVLQLRAASNPISQSLRTVAPTFRVSLAPMIQPSQSPLSESGGLWPNEQDAIDMLRLFQLEMSYLFPFVVVPWHVTPSELRDAEPLLYTAIMMAASQSNRSRQLRLAQVFREEVSRAVLVDGEKRLGIVQAILVYIAWNHVHVKIGHQVIVQLHLAIAQITELELDRNPRQPSRVAVGAFRALEKDASEVSPRTLDERRAFLGALWVASIIKACLKDIQGLEFTAYVQECCTVLEEAQDTPNDFYLVQLIRSQSLVDRVSKILYADEKLPIMTPALSMTISILEKEIQKQEVSAWLNSRCTPFLKLQHNMLKLHLYKIVLDDYLFQPQSSHALLRSNLLISCFHTVETLLQCFISLPSLTVLCLPFTNWAMVGHGMFVLSRAIDVQHGNYGTTALSGALSLRELYHSAGEKLDEVMAAGSKELPPRSLPEPFEQMAVKLKEMGQVPQRNTLNPERLWESTVNGNEMNFTSFDWGYEMWGV